jgi:hypothetical protein
MTRPRLRRRNGSLDRIQRRIPRLVEHARELAEQESIARAEAESLRGRRGPLARRRLDRAERRVERLAERRRVVVTGEYGEIIEHLQAQSRQTRTRLDRAMSPVVDVAIAWGQIERTFELLDEAVGAPEVGGYVEAARGTLAVPAFPVREEEGYVLPFPRDAFVF